MKLSELGVDELINIINDSEADPELRERVARYLRKKMESPE
jgi:hypothetical protein